MSALLAYDHDGDAAPLVYPSAPGFRSIPERIHEGEIKRASGASCGCAGREGTDIEYPKDSPLWPTWRPERYERPCSSGQHRVAWNCAPRSAQVTCECEPVTVWDTGLPFNQGADE